MKYLRLLAALTLALTLHGQVYSPNLLRKGQPDSTDLKKFAAGIFAQAGARTDREKAEAIWRFFLTDGRFVKPGFWYHIAGWTYEEPTGEVLDPIKLLNSYGFGLCYHIAPLLEAVFKAGGFSDARSWFLTGHTVAEVFYDGGYHYFDSDMMGYNVPGDGPFQGKPVSSVHDLERNGNIILGKLAAPNKVKAGVVDNPWYPADVRAKAMGDLANLFTTANDNHLYPYTRYSVGHTMDFELRPGEQLIRYFEPEEPGLFYLPYKFDGKQWTEFPKEIAEYKIRTSDGPRSQKDGRLWATGRIEYTPRSVANQPAVVIDMPSPYVIIDAKFSMSVELPTGDSKLRVETSTDGGRTWALAGKIQGPHHGRWTTEPEVIAKTAHGRFTAVSGTYGYKVRITKPESQGASINALELVSRIQLNPRTLPAVEPGENQFVYSADGPIRRVAISAPLGGMPKSSFELISQNGQQFLLPSKAATGEVTYELDANGSPLTGFDAGVRFLDLRGGLAPDKLTAETRQSGMDTQRGEASMEWSLSPDGPFHQLAHYPEQLHWRDHNPIDRLLLWPEYFQTVRDLPAGTSHVFVRFRSSGPALDSVRLAAYARDAAPKGRLKLTQVWVENGRRQEHQEELPAATRKRQFTIKAGGNVRNQAVILAAE